MSETLKKIKDQLSLARLERRPTSFISLVISECEKVGKDKENRDSTEDEVQAVLKKLIANNELSLKHAVTPHDTIISEEIEFLSSFRPKMASEEDLRSFIVKECSGMQIGQVMDAVKKKFGSSADMKSASLIFKSLS